MNTAIFKKYNKNLNLEQAIANIEHLKSIGTTPMKYIVSFEFACSRSILDCILKNGSVNDLNIDSTYWLQSICDIKNNWHCIKLTNNSNSKAILIYTGGTSYIMYYSII